MLICWVAKLEVHPSRNSFYISTFSRIEIEWRPFRSSVLNYGTSNNIKSPEHALLDEVKTNFQLVTKVKEESVEMEKGMQKESGLSWWKKAEMIPGLLYLYQLWYWTPNWNFILQLFLACFKTKLNMKRESVTNIKTSLEDLLPLFTALLDRWTKQWVLMKSTRAQFGEVCEKLSTAALYYEAVVDSFQACWRLFIVQCVSS